MAMPGQGGTIMSQGENMSSQSRIGAIFDLDNTLIHGATLPILAPVLYSHGLISPFTLAQAAIGAKYYEHFGASEKLILKMKELVADIVDGWDVKEILALVEGEISPKFDPQIIRESLDRVKHHIKQGHRVVVISSSPIQLVLPVAQLFKISDVIATRIAIDENGKCTREFDEWVFGPTKVDALLRWAAQHDVDLSQSFAYSDSHTDVPLLKAVGFPTAVNPDKKLEKYARANGWEHYFFDKPIVASAEHERPLVNSPWIRAGVGAAAIASAGAAGVVLTRRLKSYEYRLAGNSSCEHWRG